MGHYRRIECEVRPMTPERARLYERRRSGLYVPRNTLVAGGLVAGGATLAARGLTTDMDRRRFLRTTGLGLAGAGVVGTAGLNTGCEFVMGLLGVLLDSLLWALSDAISGAFEVVNDSSDRVNMEIQSELFHGGTDYASFSDRVDGFSCIATLEPNSGLQEVVWCEGVHAQQAGAHVIEAAALGDVVESDIFEVE